MDTFGSFLVNIRRSALLYSITLLAHSLCPSVHPILTLVLVEVPIDSLKFKWWWSQTVTGQRKRVPPHLSFDALKGTDVSKVFPKKWQQSSLLFY